MEKSPSAPEQSEGAHAGDTPKREFLRVVTDPRKIPGAFVFTGVPRKALPLSSLSEERMPSQRKSKRDESSCTTHPSGSVTINCDTD